MVYKVFDSISNNYHTTTYPKLCAPSPIGSFKNGRKHQVDLRTKKYLGLSFWGHRGPAQAHAFKLNQVTGYNINSKSCITPRFGEWCARVRRCSSCFVGTGWTLCLIGSSTYFSADSEWRMIIKNARTHTR